MYWINMRRADRVMLHVQGCGHKWPLLEGDTMEGWSGPHATRETAEAKARAEAAGRVVETCSRQSCVS